MQAQGFGPDIITAPIVSESPSNAETQRVKEEQENA